MTYLHTKNVLVQNDMDVQITQLTRQRGHQILSIYERQLFMSHVTQCFVAGHILYDVHIYTLN